MPIEPSVVAISGLGSRGGGGGGSRDDVGLWIWKYVFRKFEVSIYETSVETRKQLTLKATGFRQT